MSEKFQRMIFAHLQSITAVAEPRETMCRVLVAILVVAMAMPGAAQAQAADVSSPDERLIIVTIANDVGPTVRAGSSSRAYDGMIGYTASTRARRIAGALAADYHLRSVSAWPIAVLHVHCIVFEIPDGRSRQSLVEALARDRRVKLVQPMNAFRTLGERYNDPYVGL
jgi:hypothetical protein